MKRTATHLGKGAAPAPDSNRIVVITDTELHSIRARLAAVTAELATFKTLTPLRVINVSAESIYAGRAMLTWDLQSGGGTPTHFNIGAIDATTGARHENIAGEEGSDAIGSVVVNAAELRVGRKLHFFVTAIVQSAHGVTLFSSAPSDPSKPITIQAKDFSAVPLNATTLLKSDCSALAKVIVTPRDATHGKWSSAQHSGAMRSIFVRGLGLVRVPRLGKAIKARAPTLLAAISQVANSTNVMRDVMRFAVPQYCTPTYGEASEICTTCISVSGDPAGLARWLSRGVDPNTVDVDGDSLPGYKGAPLLFIAAAHGHLGLIDLLLESGADVDKETTDDGSTPLYIAAHIAAQHGDLTVVTKLIASGADVNKARTTDSSTPLYIAAQEGHVGLIDLLLESGADVDKAETDDGSTPLYIAAQNADLTVMTKLIAAGADVNKAKTINGCTPLFIAVEKGLAVVTKLIAAGADVNKAMTTGATPLYLAAQNGDLTVVTKLIAVGADVDKARTTDGCTPLFIAVEKGHFTVVTKLIAAGALVDKAETDDNCTPLYIAAQEGHTAIVSKLLQHGADKSIRGFRNRTPLEQAQRNNHAAIVALLS